MSKREIDEDDSSIFDIDPYKLDKEWEEQPKLFRKYSVKLAEARYRVEVLKGQLEFVVAELERDVRRHPDRFRIKRISEKAINSAVILQDEYQYQLAALNKAKFKMEKLAATVKALEQRKYALQDYVELRRQDWFADPKMKNLGLDEDVAMLMKKEARSGMRRKQQRQNEDDDD